jgi:hypothetical protein
MRIYRGNRNRERKITPEKKEALEQIPGWRWGNDRQSQWWELLEAVKSFQRERGGLPSTHSKDPAESRLGYWCVNQKRIYRGNRNPKRSKITPEKKEALEQIPGWFWLWRETTERAA